MDKLQTINLTGAKFSGRTPYHYPKPKMLLVEDNLESAALMQYLCQKINCNLNVSCVPSAQSALHLLEKDSHYDLIISDHFLTGETTGLELWKICKEKFKIPFLVTSGLTTKEFLMLLNGNEKAPPFLSKTLAKNMRQQILEGFLNETLKKPRTVSKTFAGFLFDTMTFIGIVLLLCVLPNHLSFQPTPIELKEKVKMDAQPQPKHINVKEIITPELRQRIDRIVRRADEINDL
jgi:CheY-like chemotaxis protein